MLKFLRPSSYPKKSGQILIETAIILPAFIILTLGIIDLVRMLYVYEGLTGGVREGARYFISQPVPTGTNPPDPTPNARKRVKDYFNGGAAGNGRFGAKLQDNGDITIINMRTSVTPAPGTNWPNVGDMIRVKVSTQVPLIVGGFFGLFGGNHNINLSSEIQMSYLGV